MDKLFYKKVIENNLTANDNDLKAFANIFGIFCAG